MYDFNLLLYQRLRKIQCAGYGCNPCATGACCPSSNNDNSCPPGYYRGPNGQCIPCGPGGCPPSNSWRQQNSNPWNPNPWNPNPWNLNPQPQTRPAVNPWTPQPSPRPSPQPSPQPQVTLIA